MLNHKQIAFIGGGVMAEAIIKGLLREAMVSPAQIIASGPRVVRGQELAERYRIRVTSDNVQAVDKADVVVLSVKPQVLPRVLGELTGHTGPDILVVSIVAGAPMAAIQHALKGKAVTELKYK